MRAAVVVVFARAPVAGRVKSRLARTIGAEPAARVYEALLRHTLVQVGAAGARVVVSLAERPPAAWAPPPDLAVDIQTGDDLGTRMADAFARRFAAGDEAVALVGSDIPLLSADVIRDAFAACRRTPVVIAPALDGGYVLVAQRAPGVPLFSGVPWSSPDTMAATRHRLAALGVAYTELPALGDLDTLDDLRAFTATPGLDADLRRAFMDAVAHLDSARRLP